MEKENLENEKKNLKFRGYEECEKWYKECKQSILLSYIASHFLYPQQLFSIFNFQFSIFWFYFSLILSLICMDNGYYCILKRKKIPKKKVKFWDFTFFIPCLIFFLPWQLFSVFKIKILIFYFLSITSLIGIYNKYYSILKFKKKTSKWKKKNLNFKGTKNVRKSMKNVRKSMKNVSNPHFYHTLPHILRIPNNY